MGEFFSCFSTREKIGYPLTMIIFLAVGLYFFGSGCRSGDAICCAAKEFNGNVNKVAGTCRAEVRQVVDSARVYNEKNNL